jgi:CspA family cold shock protein
MTTGTVKWFNEDMGFGFVAADNGREEFFAHHSEINMRGFKLLKTGQKVVFDVTRIPGGKEASHIRVVR